MISNLTSGFIPSAPTLNPVSSSSASPANTATAESPGKERELEFRAGRNAAKDYSAVQQSLAKGKGAVETAQAATSDIKESLVKVRKLQLS